MPFFLESIQRKKNPPRVRNDDGFRPLIIFQRRHKNRSIWGIFCPRSNVRSLLILLLTTISTCKCILQTQFLCATTMHVGASLSFHEYPIALRDKRIKNRGKDRGSKYIIRRSIRTIKLAEKITVKFTVDGQARATVIIR